MPQIAYGAAMWKMAPDDFRELMKVVDACGEETTVLKGTPDLHTLIQNLATFGSCMPGTALYVAAMNKRGGNWGACLVRDPEFLEGDPLARHWVAVDLDHPDAPAVDVTVADQEKDMIALGNAAEREEIVELLENKADTLRRLKAGLDHFFSAEGRPVLPEKTAEILLNDVYVPLLDQPVRSRRLIHVVPLSCLVPDYD